MNNIIFKYYYEEDNLYIQFSRKKSPIGDEEFQDGVILFRDNKGILVGIEIYNYSDFTETKIKIDSSKYVDFKEPFGLIKQFITVAELRESYPQLWKEFLENSGFEKVKEKDKTSPIKIRFPKDTFSELSV